MFVCVFMYVCSCARLYFQVLVHAHGHKHTRETRKTTQSRVCNENLQVVALVSAVHIGNFDERSAYLSQIVTSAELSYLEKLHEQMNLAETAYEHIMHRKHLESSNPTEYVETQLERRWMDKLVQVEQTWRMKLDQHARIEHVKRVRLEGREAAVRDVMQSQLAAAEAQHVADVKKLREQIEDQQQQIQHLTEMSALPAAGIEIQEALKMREHTLTQRDALIDDLYRQLEASKGMVARTQEENRKAVQTLQAMELELELHHADINRLVRRDMQADDERDRKKYT